MAPAHLLSHALVQAMHLCLQVRKDVSEHTRSVPPIKPKSRQCPVLHEAFHAAAGGIRRLEAYGATAFDGLKPIWFKSTSEVFLQTSESYHKAE